MAKVVRFIVSVVIVATVVPSLLLAQDMIFFKNGDRLSGEIRNIQLGNLVLHSHSLESDVTIDWDRIERIKSERVFQIQTISGEKFLGQITPTETVAGTLAVTSGGVTRVLQHDDIFLVTETVRGLNGLLQVNAGAGVSLAKSNDQKQWSAQVSVSYETPNYGMRGTFDSQFATQEAVDDTKRNDLNLDFYRKLPDRWGLAALGGFLNSSAQNLDLRTTFGGGPAYDFVRRQDFVVRAIGGGVWVKDQYDPDVVSDSERSQIAGLGGVLLSFNRFKQWQLDSSFFAFPSFSSTFGTLLGWRVNLRLRLIHGQRLWWNFTNSVDYDSNPPDGSSGSDYVFTTSVTYDFP